jgi:hypothetical protein
LLTPYFFPASIKPKKRRHPMTEQTMTQETSPKSKAARIVRQIFQWGILALLLFTCIMAAYRKFGG